jgi:hypothetical protein
LDFLGFSVVQTITTDETYEAIAGYEVVRSSTSAWVPLSSFGAANNVRL